MPSRQEILFLLPVLALLYAVPLITTQPYFLQLLIITCLYAIPAVGLNLMLGYTGLVSLGHMAFAGIGGYVAAVLMVDAGVSFWAALPVGGLAAAASGAVIGLICLRLRHHFFVIVTLAFGLILGLVMNNWDAVTRGAQGFIGIPRPDPLRLAGTAIRFTAMANFYDLALTLLLVVLALQALIIRSDFGRTLTAIREDETLARFRGVDTMLYKTAIFAIGSGIAGLGGALSVSFLRVAAPSSFDLMASINIVVIVIIGGAGFLLGPVWGALIFVGIPEYLRILDQERLILFGALLILLTLFAPQGLAGLFAACRRRWRHIPS
jgi:branched-chain amino acid transport system permease protein